MSGDWFPMEDWRNEVEGSVEREEACCDFLREGKWKGGGKFLGPTEDSFRPFGHGVPAGEIERRDQSCSPPPAPNSLSSTGGFRPAPATSTATRAAAVPTPCPAAPRRSPSVKPICSERFFSGRPRTVRIKAIKGSIPRSWPMSFSPSAAGRSIGGFSHEL